MNAPVQQVFLSQAVGAWTPAALGADVWAWWKFDAMPDANGATISSVVDASGNGRSLTMFGTPTAKAAGQNGLKTANFRVGTSYGTFAGMGALASASFFGVNISGAGPSDTTFGALVDTGSDISFNHYTYGGTVYCDWMSNTRKTAGAVTVNFWHQVMFWSATNDWGHAMDGTDKFTTGSNTVAANATSYLGADANGVSTWRFQGEAGEVVILQNKPTSANRQRMEGYLAWKWGLVAALPAGHSFKSAAPKIGDPVWVPTYSQSIAADITGWGGYNVRVVAPSANLLVSGSKVRVTMAASTSSGGFVIDAAEIGHAAASGDAYDFNGGQIPLTFNGGNAGCTVAQGATIISDVMTFNLDKTKNFIVAAHFASGSIKYSGSGPSSYYKNAANEVSVSDVSGYTTYSPLLVSLIEVLA